MQEEIFEVRDQREGNWLWIPKKILENEKIGQKGKIVYCCLAYFTNKKQECFPSITKILLFSGYKKRQIITDSIALLEKEKIVKVKRTKGKKSIYILVQ